MKQQTRYKNYRSLFLLLGMLVVTVWGYGQETPGESDTEDSKPYEIAFDNSRNEGYESSLDNKYMGFFHEKEEIVYLAPSDKLMIEVFGTGGAQLDRYIRWYVGKVPEGKSQDIKEYMDVNNPIYDPKDWYYEYEKSDGTPTTGEKNHRYLYYKDTKTDKTGYLYYTQALKQDSLRYVYLKVPDDMLESEEYVIYCDLGKYIMSVPDLQKCIDEKTFIPKRVALRRKYVIRHASRMAKAMEAYNEKASVEANEASFVGNYEIHAPIDANYITLRLPQPLTNYYTKSSNTNLKGGEDKEWVQPEYLHWHFYKKGEEQNGEPVYTVITKNNNTYKAPQNNPFFENWNGLINLGGTDAAPNHNVHLRPHVLDLAMNMLQIPEESKTIRQTYTVIASLGNETETDVNKKIVTLTLNLEPYYKAMTQKDFEQGNEAYRFRSEEVLEKYYKSLGNISFNNEEEGKGEGHNGQMIVDANETCILNSELKDGNNMGIVPLQQEYSDYGFGAFSINGAGNHQLSGKYLPGRGEYAFMRSIGDRNSGTNNEKAQQWYHFTTIPSGESQEKAFTPFGVYDRLHQLNEEKYGFFMYVDADESPDLVTLLPIDNAHITLCKETQIVVTAWVCNLNRNSDGDRLTSVKEIIEKPSQKDGVITSTPASILYPEVSGTDLGFTFKGIRDNTEDIIYKYYTGEIENNVRTALPSEKGTYANNDGKIPAEWTQIYMSFTIPAGTKYKSYKLEVASNCLHTNGGDFAIDDIRVYMSQPEVSAIQENPCDETSHLLIKANYDLLLANVGLNEARMTTGEPIKTWTDKSMELDQEVEDKVHGAHPRHYHMYYTIVEEYDLQDGETGSGNSFISKDKKGWVVKDEENNKYWRYLFLNYNNEKDNTGTDRNVGDTKSTEADAYGTVVISSYYADMPTKQEIMSGITNPGTGVNIDQLAWIETEKGQQWVVFDELTIDYDILNVGKTYYIQLFPHETGGERPFPSNQCAISNTFKLEKSHTIYVNAATKLDGTTIVPDDATLSSDLNILDLSERTTDEDGVTTPQRWITAEDMYFDWYLGNMNDPIDDQSTSITVGEALKLFRLAYQDMGVEEEDNDESILAKPNEGFTEAMATFINGTIDSKLFLCRNKLELSSILEDYSTITLSPIGLEQAKKKGVKFFVNGEEWEGFDSNKDYIYCDGPYQFSVRVGELIPASVNQTIRIGSWQLVKLKEDKNKYLRIPVFNAVKGLQKDDDKTDVVLTAIDEEEVTIGSQSIVAQLDKLEINAVQVADAEGIEDENISKLDPKSNYLDLKFDGDKVVNFDFKEGHTYTVKFNYQKNDQESTRTSKTAELHIKVVPEYLTWNGSVSSDWNNDKNWERSDRGNDLYFGKEDPKDQGDALTYAFAPMKGSYVTMKKINQGTTTVLNDLGDNNGAGLEVNNILELIDNKIQYEVVAEDPYVSNESTNESTDIWHKQGDLNDGNRYYAIYYYGNWCKEVYFKPEAMLQNQQHLTYEKAWVDFELTPERWYLLSSPLQDVVSGDMYLPADKDHFGRQETKAFSPIHYNYGDHGAKTTENIGYYGVTNNRFNPAVYQRTWNGAATNYGFDMNKSDLIIQGDWSNLHNDVYKSYIPGTGFSVGVQLRSGEIQNPNGKTLFRLPKADEKYQLQSSENTGSYTEVTLPGNITKLQRSNKLVEIKGDKVEITIPTSTTRQATNEDYYLIGNPFMAALDMSKFLAGNQDQIANVIRLFTEEGETVYTITQEGATLSNISEQISTIAPLQGFMVKKAESWNGTITFNTNMTTVEKASATLRSLLADAEPKAAFPQLFITAERDGQQSSAMVACREEASVGYRDGEDIVMITDPDRMEVPTVYTLAGNRAVIIHSTPDMHNIPLGIYSDNKDPVVVRFSGVETFNVPVYLYDAETQTSTLIASSNQELTLPGNTHGRYFLRSDYVPTGNDVVKAKGAISIYSMMPGQVIVSSIDPLTRIWVYNLSGQLVTSRNNLNTPTAYIDGLLPGQIYIVKAETANRIQTEKVEVR